MGRGGGTAHNCQENYNASRSFLIPRKQESLRHFLVITGRAGPSAPGTLKHLCVHFKFLSHVTFIQQLCPVLGVRENKKLPLLSESADRGRIGYSSVIVGDAERKGLLRRGQGHVLDVPRLSLLGQRLASCWVLQNSIYQNSSIKTPMHSGYGQFWEQSIGKRGQMAQDGNGRMNGSSRMF